MTATPLGVRAAFMVEYLDLPAATGEAGATWDPYQLVMLSDDGMFSIYRKARQIGWSFTAAADAVAECTLEPGSTCIFVSINREEAKEKVRYAKAVLAALDGSVRPKVLDDNQSSVEFVNGSRILSHPSRPIRGRAKARVYLDEFAHYAKDTQIYQSALPATTRGGFIRIGSTPLGTVGMFHDIASQDSRPYPGYRRFSIPWWSVVALCKDTMGARDEAGSTPTEDLVAKYGTGRLVNIHANMLAEDFRQEYELDWSDESVSFITWEEVKAAQAMAQAENIQTRWVASVPEAHAAVNALANDVGEGRAEPSMFVGMDIGRRHDLSEITVLGKTTTEQLVYRLGVSLANTPFDQQEGVMHAIMDQLPVRKMAVDETGMGLQFAEQLVFHYGRRVLPVSFTNDTKEAMAVGVKLRMQKGQLLLSADRNLASQLHSIKRQITSSKNVVFDVARSEKHHADRFWSLALAVLAAHGPKGGFFR